MEDLGRERVSHALGSDGPAPGELALDVRPGAHEVVIVVRGELDLYTADRLDRRFTSLLTGGARRMAVDLTDTHFIDSTGIRILIRARQRLQEAGGALRLVAPSRQVQKVLDVAGLSRVFEITAA